MSLNFGTIYGSINLDTSKWTKGLDQAFKAGDRMVAQSKTSFTRGGDEAGRGFATGVQRNTKGLGAVVGRLAESAPPRFAKAGASSGDQFASGVTRAMAGLSTRFHRAGQESGAGFSSSASRSINLDGAFRGLSARLSTQRATFADAGQESGEGFDSGAGDGVAGLGGTLTGALSGAKAGLIGAAVTIGAAIGAILTTAITEAFDMQGVTDKLAASLDVHGPEAKRLGGIAGRLYGNGFGESYEQVADAIRAVKINDLLPADAIDADVERVTGKLLNMANVLDQDVGLTAQAVGKMVLTGMAPDVEAAMDLVTTAIQRGGDRAGDLTATMQEYSTQFRALGIDGATAMGMFIQGLQGGARDTDVIADSMKEFALKSQGAMTTTVMVGDRSAAALKKVAAAERTVEDAQRSTMRAQKALTDARAEAAQQIRDLADQTGDAALDEEAAAIAVLRAQERLNALPADASALDRREAVLGLQQAQEALGDQQKRVLELQDAQARANAEGVDGSEKVLNAFYGVLEAQQGLGDATDELRESRVELSQSYGHEETKLTALGEAYRSLGIDGVWAQKEIAKGGKPAAAVLDLVLDRLRGIEDPVLRNTTAVALFGTKAEDLQGALMAIDPTTALMALGDTTHSTDELAEAFRGVNSIADLLQRKGMKMLLNALDDIAGSMYGIAMAVQIVWPIVAGAFDSLWSKISAVQSAMDRFVGWVMGIGDRIRDKLSGMWDGMKEGFATVINWIVDAWNGLGFKLPTVSIPGVGSIGGWEVGPKYGDGTLPHVKFHQGTGPGGVPGMPGQEVPALLLAGETVRTTSQERGLQQAMAQLGAIAANGLAVAAGGSAGPVSGGAGGGGVINLGGIHVPVKITGPVAGKDGAVWIRETINEGIRKGAINAEKMLRAKPGSLRSGR